MPTQPPLGHFDLMREFAEHAVRCSDGRLEFPRFATRQEAEAFVADRYAVKEDYRRELEEWEVQSVEGELHPSGTNEPWWRWHKNGWKDKEWRVVVRAVTRWEDA